MTAKAAAVGWQGITVKAPADWSLAGVSGDEKKGYFRVDGPVASALEVRWSPALGKPPDLMAKGREFVSGIEKECRKKKARFSSSVKPEKDRAGSVGFLWRADRLGQGRLVYCQKCDRVTIAQIISARDENVSQVAPAILDSLKDHRGDGWTDWALYGLAFAVPPGYRAEKQTLMSGYIALGFKSGARTLVVERWGLASTLMAEYALAEWYRKDALPDVKGYRVQLSDEAVAGHPGLKIEGVRSGIRQAARAAARSLTLHPHPRLLSGWAWHCEDSNRLFSIRATHAEDDHIAAKVRDLIKCH